MKGAVGACGGVKALRCAAINAEVEISVSFRAAIVVDNILNDLQRAGVTGVGESTDDSVAITRRYRYGSATRAVSRATVWQQGVTVVTSDIRRVVNQRSIVCPYFLHRVACAGRNIGCPGFGAVTSGSACASAADA